MPPPCHDIHRTGDGVLVTETEDNIRKRYTSLYKQIRPAIGNVTVKQFVFAHGFDGDDGLGAQLNQSSVDFMLWMVEEYHDLLHIFRCGVDGSDQVERMSTLLYNTFFKDVEDYVGNEPDVIESLPTADTCADPRGEIHYLKKINRFSGGRRGYVGAATWMTKRTLPYDLEVPRWTVHGEPMAPLYFEHIDNSYREDVEIMLKTGLAAYNDVFQRMKGPNSSEKIGSHLSASFEVPNSGYSMFPEGDGQIFQEIFPPRTMENHVLFGILESLQYFHEKGSGNIYMQDRLLDIGVISDSAHGAETLWEILMEGIQSYWVDEENDRDRNERQRIAISYFKKTFGDTSFPDKKSGDFLWQKIANAVSVPYTWSFRDMHFLAAYFNFRFRVFTIDDQLQLQLKYDITHHTPYYNGVNYFAGCVPLDVYLVYHPEENDHAFSTLLPERYAETVESDVNADKQRPADEMEWENRVDNTNFPQVLTAEQQVELAEVEARREAAIEHSRQINNRTYFRIGKSRDKEIYLWYEFIPRHAKSVNNVENYERMTYHEILTTCVPVDPIMRYKHILVDASYYNSLKGYQKVTTVQEIDHSKPPKLVSHTDRSLIPCETTQKIAFLRCVLADDFSNGNFNSLIPDKYYNLRVVGYDDKIEQIKEQLSVFAAFGSCNILVSRNGLIVKIGMHNPTPQTRADLKDASWEGEYTSLPYLDNTTGTAETIHLFMKKPEHGVSDDEYSRNAVQHCTHFIVCVDASDSDKETGLFYIMNRSQFLKMTAEVRKYELSQHSMQGLMQNKYHVDIVATSYICKIQTKHNSIFLSFFEEAANDTLQFKPVSWKGWTTKTRMKPLIWKTTSESFVYNVNSVSTTDSFNDLKVNFKFIRGQGESLAISVQFDELEYAYVTRQCRLAANVFRCDGDAEKQAKWWAHFVFDPNWKPTGLQDDESWEFLDDSDRVTMERGCARYRRYISPNKKFWLDKESLFIESNIPVSYRLQNAFASEMRNWVDRKTIQNNFCVVTNGLQFEALDLFLPTSVAASTEAMVSAVSSHFLGVDTAVSDFTQRSGKLLNMLREYIIRNGRIALNNQVDWATTRFKVDLSRYFWKVSEFPYQLDFSYKYVSQDAADSISFTSTSGDKLYFITKRAGHVLIFKHMMGSQTADGRHGFELLNAMPGFQQLSDISTLNGLKHFIRDHSTSFQWKLSLEIMKDFLDVVGKNNVSYASVTFSGSGGLDITRSYWGKDSMVIKKSTNINKKTNAVFIDTAGLKLLLVLKDDHFFFFRKGGLLDDFQLLNSLPEYESLSSIYSISGVKDFLLKNAHDFALNEFGLQKLLQEFLQTSGFDAVFALLTTTVPTLDTEKLIWTAGDFSVELGGVRQPNAVQFTSKTSGSVFFLVVHSTHFDIFRQYLHHDGTELELLNATPEFKELTEINTVTGLKSFILDHIEVFASKRFSMVSPIARSSVMLNVCAAIWIGLLSLWTLPNSLTVVNHSQLQLLNHLFGEWVDFDGFMRYIFHALQKPALKSMLIPKQQVQLEAKKVYHIDTWWLNKNRILCKQKVSTSSEYAKAKLEAENKRLLMHFGWVSASSLQQSIRLYIDDFFIRMVREFDRNVRDIEGELVLEDMHATAETKLQWYSLDIEPAMFFSEEQRIFNNINLKFKAMVIGVDKLPPSKVSDVSRIFSEFRDLFFIFKEINAVAFEGAHSFSSRAAYRIYGLFIAEINGDELQANIKKIMDTCNLTFAQRVKEKFKEFSVVGKDSMNPAEFVDRLTKAMLDETYIFRMKEIESMIPLSPPPLPAGHIFSMDSVDEYFSSKLLIWLKDHVNTYLRTHVQKKWMDEIQFCLRKSIVRNGNFDKFVKEVLTNEKSTLKEIIQDTKFEVSTLGVKDLCRIPWKGAIQDKCLRFELYYSYKKQIQALREISGTDFLTFYYNKIDSRYIDLLNNKLKSCCVERQVDSMPEPLELATKQRIFLKRQGPWEEERLEWIKQKTIEWQERKKAQEQRNAPKKQNGVEAVQIVDDGFSFPSLPTRAMQTIDEDDEEIEFSDGSVDGRDDNARPVINARRSGRADSVASSVWEGGSQFSDTFFENEVGELKRHRSDFAPLLDFHVSEDFKIPDNPTFLYLAVCVNKLKNACRNDNSRRLTSIGIYDARDTVAFFSKERPTLANEMFFFSGSNDFIRCFKTETQEWRVENYILAVGGAQNLQRMGGSDSLKIIDKLRILLGLNDRAVHSCVVMGLKEHAGLAELKGRLFDIFSVWLLEHVLFLKHRNFKTNDIPTSAELLLNEGSRSATEHYWKFVNQVSVKTIRNLEPKIFADKLGVFMPLILGVPPADFKTHLQNASFSVNLVKLGVEMITAAVSKRANFKFDFKIYDAVQTELFSRKSSADMTKELLDFKDVFFFSEGGAVVRLHKPAKRTEWFMETFVLKYAKSEGDEISHLNKEETTDFILRQSTALSHYLPRSVDVKIRVNDFPFIYKITPVSYLQDYFSLWILESFVREVQTNKAKFDGAEEFSLYIQRKLRGQNLMINYYWIVMNSTIPVILTRLLPPSSPARATQCIYSTTRDVSHLNASMSNLSVDFTNPIAQELQLLSTDELMRVMVSILNLSVNVYEPYDDLRFAMFVDSTQVKTRDIMLQPVPTVYKSRLDLYYNDDRKESVYVPEINELKMTESAFVSRAVASSHDPQKFLKAQFLIDADTKRMVRNCGDFEGKDAFFEALAARYTFSDGKMAKLEFFLSLKREVDELSFASKITWDLVIQDRMQYIHRFFKDRINGGVPFHKRDTHELWAMYWFYIRDGLKDIQGLWEQFFPNQIEIRHFCKQQKCSISIANLTENVSEFESFSRTNEIEIAGLPPDQMKKMKNSYIRMLHFNTKKDPDVFCRYDYVYDRANPHNNDIVAVNYFKQFPEVVYVHGLDIDEESNHRCEWSGAYRGVKRYNKDAVSSGVITGVRSVAANSKCVVFSGDIYVKQDAGESDSFVMWVIHDCWYIATTRQFEAFVNWCESGYMAGGSSNLRFEARIQQTLDILGTKVWQVRHHANGKMINNSVRVDREPMPQVGLNALAVFNDRGLADTGDIVPKFELHLLNPTSTGWTDSTQLPVNGLFKPRNQNPAMVAMRLWDSDSRQSLNRTILGLRDSRDDDDADESESSKKKKGTKVIDGVEYKIVARTRTVNIPLSQDDNELEKSGDGNTEGAKGGKTGKGGKGRDAGSLSNTNSWTSEGSGSGGAGRGNRFRSGGFYGGGGGRKVKGKRRQGNRPGRIGSKRICKNRKQGQEAPPKYTDPVRGDDRGVERFNDWKGRAHITEQKWRDRHPGFQSLYDSQREYFGLGLLMGPHTGTPHRSAPQAVVDEDDKETSMLTTALVESILTALTFGNKDCVSIKIIQGMTLQCRILATFLSCFFEKSALLNMFDCFTDNLTYAGKGFLADMADDWDVKGLLMQVADMKVYQFLELLDKIPEIWQSRSKYIQAGDARDTDLHAFVANTEEESMMLWWAHHRSLTITIAAFLSKAIYDAVAPNVYITEREAIMSNRLFGRRASNRTQIVEFLQKSPMYTQLASLFKMVESMNVRSPTRPLYTHRDARFDYRKSVNVMQQYAQPVMAAASQRASRLRLM